MESGIAYLFAIIFFVIALNLFFVFRRLKSNTKRRPGRIAYDEAKQAAWREKEVQRRITREVDDAYHRVQLRNETLAFYTEVRRRAAAREREGAEQEHIETERVEMEHNEPEV